MGAANSVSLPDLITQAELCRILNKSHAWAERGRLEGYGPPYYRIGRSIRYALSDVHAWMNANRWHSTSQKASEAS